jgi:RNA polymerase sigma factor (sigma-70 family)
MDTLALLGEQPYDRGLVSRLTAPIEVGARGMSTTEAETESSAVVALVSMVMRGTSVHERDQAMAALQPVIRGVARRVCAGHRTQAARDFIDEAASYVWEKMAGFSDERGFENWCFTMLRNLFIDRWRRRSTELKAIAAGVLEGRERLHRTDSATERMQIEQALDREEPLSEQDLSTIDSWLPEDRIVLLVLSGLWPKVLADRWNSYLQEVELAVPFPPHELLDMTDLKDRNEFLAQALGWKRNSLSQRWHRKRGQLLGLNYLRGHIDDE